VVAAEITTTKVAETTEKTAGLRLANGLGRGGRRHLAPAFLSALLSAAALFGCGGDQGSAPAKSVPAQKLEAAAAAMRTVSAFRFTADVDSGSQQVHVTGEFTAPNALHETVKIGANTVEALWVGTRAFRRNSATAAWQVVAPASASAPTDPRSAFGVLANATSVHMQGSSYVFSLSKANATSLVKGSNAVTGAALLDGGRITDLTYQATSPAVAVHLTYAGFNATPPVTPPPGL
jgi:hypothetical protein